MRVRVRGEKNKAGYTATLVACGWAVAVLEKVTRAFGEECKLEKLKNAKEQGTNLPTYQPIDRPTD